MEKIDLIEELFKLCRESYMSGLDDGVNGWGYDFNDIHVLSRIQYLIGGIECI